MKPVEALERGRDSCQRRAWASAYDSLSLADQVNPLGPADLELLAMSAYLISRDDDYITALDRAHHAYLDAGESLRAVRCAFWLGLRLLFRGETGRASGWLGRAQRLLERESHDCVEHGYLLLPLVQAQIDDGNAEAAYATSDQAVRIGERFDEADLVAIARHLQGLVRLQQEQVESGLALLDESMIAVTTGELSPLVAGLVYCGVIDGCQQVYELDRAREWTHALAQWCNSQPEMIAFSGVCRVHRAEIMQWQGAWAEAIEEAQHAGKRCALANNTRALAAAFYQEAEVHRLRGEFPEAEEAYRKASRSGGDPQPGLALLRLAQGHPDAAVAAMNRILHTSMARLQRMKLLPACIEIMLAVGDMEQARGACVELQEIAQSVGTDVLAAMAVQARGELELAEGDARSAFDSLHRAWRVWQDVDAPYLAARVRMSLALACRALGDEEGCRLEFEAARSIFEQLEAVPDLARIDAHMGSNRPGYSHGLTPRELQVLRLVAAGKSNKAIARDLFLSTKTIDRHVSNLFDKLDVASRSSATAYAYEHKLV